MVDMLYSEDAKTIKEDARRRYHGIHQRHRKGMRGLGGYREQGAERSQRYQSGYQRKVREAARQIGYMPNSAARALKTNRTYNLGVLFVDEAQSGLTHEFFAAVLDSFKRHAEGRGYDITFINHNIGHGHSSYLEHCRYRGVDGVIAACIKFDDPEVIELANSNLPIVTVDHVFNNRAAVLSDNTDGVHKLVDQLAALGHERIAYIHGENHSAVTQKRLVGFYRACAAHGITGAGRLHRAEHLPRCEKLRRCDPSAAGTAAAAHLHHLPG